MAIARDISKKAPSQNPTDFYKLQQQGGAQGKPTRVSDQLTGGPMVEKIFGKPELSKQ